MNFERKIAKQKAYIFDECFSKEDFNPLGDKEPSCFMQKVKTQYDLISSCFDKTNMKDELVSAIKAQSQFLTMFPPMTYIDGEIDEVNKHLEFLTELDAFLHSWYDDSSYIEVSTSGSTGVPKKIQVEKERMMNSATTTLSFLGLKNGNKAHLCMPLKYIAGKMIVVRSLVLGMKIIATAPSSNPLKNFTSKYVPDFSAMVPLQVSSTLQSYKERELLKQIQHLIIGGGAVNDETALVLSDFPHNVWSTYGMTETLSHIALKRLSGDKASYWYTKFDGVNLTLSDEGTLVIDAPLVCSERLVTNDIVEFNEKGQFRILGRKDNTVNTGGVKVQIEEVERLITEVLRNTPAIMPACGALALDSENADANNLSEDNVLNIGAGVAPIVGSFDFAVTAVPDSKYGEKIILLLALKGEDHGGDYARVESMMSSCFEVLPKYHAPKSIIRVDAIPQTETGKIDRANCKRLAIEHQHTK